MARWQSGYAAACKAVYAGSIPTLASMLNKQFPPPPITDPAWLPRRRRHSRLSPFLFFPGAGVGIGIFRIAVSSLRN